MNEIEQLKKENPSIARTLEEVLLLHRQRQLDARKGPPGALMRNTYSEKHAMRLRPIFQKLIDTHENQFVPYMDYTCNPQRVYQITCDSIIWLINNDSSDAKRQLWATLRSQVKFRISLNASEGVWIEWRTQGDNSRASSAASQVSKPSDTTSRYFDTVVSWVEGNHEQVLRIERLNLSIEQQQSVKALLETAGVTTYKVTPNSITAA